MEKEELQAEVERLKKYIIDINKNWQFRVERLELSNKSLLENTTKLNRELVEKQEEITKLLADLASYDCELCGGSTSPSIYCYSCENHR